MNFKVLAIFLVVLFAFDSTASVLVGKGTIHPFSFQFHSNWFWFVYNPYAFFFQMGNALKAITIKDTLPALFGVKTKVPNQEGAILKQSSVSATKFPNCVNNFKGLKNYFWELLTLNKNRCTFQWSRLNAFDHCVFGLNPTFNFGIPCQLMLEVQNR